MSSQTIILAKRANPAPANGQHPDAYETLRAALGPRFAPQDPSDERFMARTDRPSWRIQPLTRTTSD